MRDVVCAVAIGMIAVFGSGCGDESSKRGGGEEDVDGAIFVESFPGDLVLTAPARGAFIPAQDGNLVVVAGSGASQTVVVNGIDVEPEHDGSFSASVALDPGLNVIRVESGDDAIDTPVLFGDFAPLDQPVPHAVALRVNEGGFDNVDTGVVSLTMLGQRALDDANILAALVGQQFTGSIPGGNWKFTVEDARYGDATVGLGPNTGGARFDASVSDIRVDGELSIKLGFTKTDDVTMTADAVDVGGNVKAQLSGDSIVGSANGVEAELHGFKYSSGNAGFPCCVDSIMTSYLRPKIRDAIRDKVQELQAQEVAVALSQLSLPEQIDLAGIGLPAQLHIATGFDSVVFAHNGGTVAAAAHFSADLPPGAIGESAPGWFRQDVSAPQLALEPSFGVSVSLDALNQALHAAWAQNGLRFTLSELPLLGDADIEPRLPPVVVRRDEGLVAQAGEVVVHAYVGDTPIQAAVSVESPIFVQLDTTTQQLVLTPAPNPVVSVTWLLSEGLDEGLRDILKAGIVDLLPTMLTPVSLPLPTVPLDAIAPSFAGKQAALATDSTLGLAPGGTRLDLYGDLAISDAAP